jgi:quercetin 2,3-dioxygenase
MNSPSIASKWGSKRRYRHPAPRIQSGEDGAGAFLQIWVMPDQIGLPPSYEQKAFPIEERRSQLRLVAAPDGRHGTVTVHEDARLLVANLEPGERILLELESGRGVWLQLARGIVAMNGTQMRRG